MFREAIRSFASFEEAYLQRVTPRTLVDSMARYSWVTTVEALAGMAWHGAIDGEGRDSLLLDGLRDLCRRSDTPVHRNVLAYLDGRGKGRSILHERAIHFLQELAILYGKEEGPEPSMGEIAGLALMANDWLFSAERAQNLDLLDWTFASFCHHSLFNKEAQVQSLARLAFMFGRATPEIRNPAWQGQNWEAFVVDALGMPFDDYYRGLVAPLIMFAFGLWGRRTPEGKIAPPYIQQNEWTVNNTIPPARFAQFVAEVTLDRSTAQAHIRHSLTATGLPSASELLFHHPMVRTRDQRLVVVTPAAFWEHLRTSIWDRCRRAARRLYGPEQGGEVWQTVFGDLVESWVRHVANLAMQSPGRRPDLSVLVPEAVGGVDEIEDVVVFDRGRAAFFSVKAAMMPGALPKRGADLLGIVAFWQDRLFRQKTGKGRKGRRAGAVRLLDAKADRVRRGEFEVRVPQRAVLYPLLVLYDDLGGNPLAAHWIETRSRQAGLLTQGGVRRVTPATLEDFELLMGVVANGGDIFEILDDTVNTSDQRIKSAVARYLFRNKLPRFQALDEEVETVLDDMMKHLFGTADRSLPAG